MMRKTSLQYTLISRLLSVIFCVIVASSLVATVLNVRTAEQTLRQELNDTIERTASLLAEPAWDLNGKYTNAIVDSIFIQAHAAYAEVVSDDILLAKRTAPDYPDMSRETIIQHSDFIWEINKILYNGQAIGHVFIAFSRANDRQSLLRACASSILLFLTIALPIAVLTIVLTKRHIFTPLTTLQDTAAALSKGDLDTPFPSTEPNEIGALAQSLAAMAQGIKAVTASRDDLNREIEARKQSEEQLRMLSRAIEESPFAVMVTDPEGRIEYANAMYTHMTGWSLQETAGSVADIFTCQEDQYLLLRTIQNQSRTNTPWRCAMENKKKNGDRYWESLSISALADVSGAVTHFVCVGEDITERRRVERALHDSQERLQLAVDGGGVGMWDWHIAADEVTYNDHWVTMLGYQPGELPSSVTTLRNLLHPDDAAQAMRAVSQHFKGETPLYSSEFRLKTKDGQWRWILAQGRVMSRTADGSPLRMSGTHLDITDRKNAEFTLQYKINLEGLASSISTSFLNVAQTGLDRTIHAALGLVGSFTDADRCFMIQFDDPPVVTHEWQSTNIAPLSGQLATQPMPLSWLQALRLQTFICASQGNEKSNASAEERAFLQESGIRSILMAPLLRQGETIGCIGIDSLSSDISIQRDPLWLLETLGNAISQTLESFETHKRLEESEERFRFLVESMSEGLGIIDSKGAITYVNHQLCKMLARPREEILGKTWSAFLDDKNAALYTRELQRRAQGSTDAYELSWVKPSGEKVFCLVSPTPIFDEDGTLTGSYGVYTDLTHLKLLESQLLQSQKLESIGQLAAGIAHEINTPAQYVDNNIRYLQQGFNTLLPLLEQSRELVRLTSAGKPAARLAADLHLALVDADVESLAQEAPAAFADCLDGLARIAEIVRSVKQFSHPGLKEKEMADINEAVRSTVMVSVNEWKYDATVETEYDPDLPPVPCFTSEFNQVILNLIINATHAIKDARAASSGKGCITISTSHNDAWAEIRVRDNGGGIPKHIQDKVFNPFFTTKPVGKGTGQGLAISHTIIVEKHGGSISFESEEGVGTTFIVRLPLQDATPQGAIA